MDDLKIKPNFYAENEYGEYENKLLHYATISIESILFF